MILWWLATLFVTVQLAVLVLNFFTFPVLTPFRRPPRSRRVSLLLPVRDEARNLPETLPLLLAQGADEVIVLDDGSTDATPQLLPEFRGLRCVQGAPLPEGWSGKNWACQQLAEAASGDILVFTDADVYWEPGALAALLAFAEKHDAVYASVWPRQRTQTLLERLAVPVIDLVLLGLLPYPLVKNTTDALFSAGNGQCMLWTRSAYQQVGGHAAFKGEILEDVRMGQKAKGRGLKLVLALGGELLSTRMYRTREELLEGFSKNILAAHGSRPLLVVSLLLNTLTYTLSWPLALINPLWLVPAALGMFQRALTSYKTHRSPLEAFLQPLVAYPLWRVSLRALLHRGYRWKGRTYEAHD
jgi:cellulose synthase/poly-beta-1,6-N-acetylglucosamine synthase-like glycosyltransferase